MADFTENDLNRWGELGWNARFAGTGEPKWADFGGAAKDKQLQIVRDIAKTGVASTPEESWYARAIAGEFDAPEANPATKGKGK